MSQATVRSERHADDGILTVEDLSTAFYTDKEVIRAIDGVDLTLRKGDTLGVVGESGSGKSVTARSIMGLIKSPGQVLEGSSIRYRHQPTVQRLAGQFGGRTTVLEDGAQPDPSDDSFVYIEDESGDVEGYVDLAKAPKKAMNRVRGGDIAMVFQDPLTSLNPVYTIGNQIKEALRIHQDLRGQAATEEAINLLEAVGIPDAARRLKEYPHQFSGGMRQRAVIATALACDPEVLICDEPTTALDVTIQAQILELLYELQDNHDLAIMFITHDMGVIAEVADRVSVMYAGEIVENAPAEELFADPAHPYTQGLLRSIPGRNPDAERLATIEGDVPTPNTKPSSCRFAPRCPKAFNECTAVHPQHVEVGSESVEHTAACLLYPDDRSTEEAVAHHHELAGEGGER